MTSAPLIVREHLTPQEFDSLEPVWNELVRGAPVPTLYLSFEWLRTWWECFGGGRRTLRILSVSAGDKTIAIAPFMQVRRRLFGVPFNTIEFLSSRDYAFSHLTMSGLLDVVAPERAEEVADALIVHLLASPVRWLYMRLEPLAEAGMTRRVLARRASALGLKIREGEKFEACEAELGTGWESRRITRERDASGAIEQKIRRRGDLTWEDSDGGAAGEDLFGTILGVEKRSWKWRRGLSINALGYGGFYPAFLESAARRRSLRLTVLRIDGQAVAYVFSAIFGNTLEALKTAYDSSYAGLSPGRSALWHHVRRAAAEGVARVNLHIGSKDYKSEWATDTRMYSELWFLRTTVAARLAAFFLFTLGFYGRFRFVPDLAKRIIRRLGLTPGWSELTRADQV